MSHGSSDGSARERVGPYDRTPAVIRVSLVVSNTLYDGHIGDISFIA